MKVSFSVVSHCHSEMLAELLRGFRTDTGSGYEIIITFNVKEDAGFIEEFSYLPIRIIRNEKPKGFGENHNAAFKVSSGEYFVVLNPDVEFTNFDVRTLLEGLLDTSVGVCGPEVRNSEGTVEDSARFFPSVKSLVLRLMQEQRKPDYEWQSNAVEVDWIAGMCMIFPSSVYDSIGGFDEGYFMYVEDVDICRKVHEKGLKVVVYPKLSIIHHANRQSRRNLKHFVWHLKSLIRYFVKWRASGNLQSV